MFEFLLKNKEFLKLFFFLYIFKDVVVQAPQIQVPKIDKRINRFVRYFKFKEFFILPRYLY